MKSGNICRVHGIWIFYFIFEDFVDKQVHMWNITAGVEFRWLDAKFGAKHFRQLSRENATAEIFRSLNHTRQDECTRNIHVYIHIRQKKKRSTREYC